MESSREIKSHLYEQVARIGRAIANPKRLELIEILVQGEKTVEQLARDAEISVKLTSAHLRELRLVHLVKTRRDGKSIWYRLADTHVADLWVTLHKSAESHLSELQEALIGLITNPNELSPMDAQTLLDQIEKGEYLLIDVRPEEEFQAAHLPHARSVPIGELQDRMAELPKDKPIIAYCRGPYCMWARKAVHVLRESGFDAQRIDDGIAEWRAKGLPVESK